MPSSLKNDGIARVLPSSNPTASKLLPNPTAADSRGRATGSRSDSTTAASHESPGDCNAGGSGGGGWRRDGARAAPAARSRVARGGAAGSSTGASDAAGGVACAHARAGTASPAAASKSAHANSRTDIVPF